MQAIAKQLRVGIIAFALCLLGFVTIMVGQPVHAEGAYLGDPAVNEVPADFENDLWLQYEQKAMAIGDTADLYPRRVPQIIGDAVTNDVERPMFNFQIISGDSVTLNTTSNNEKAVVTAVKAGTTVVKVTYDSKEYKGVVYGASSAVNTGYVVYTVGETGTVTPTVSDPLNSLTSYDTIYYKEGTSTPLTFSVSAAGATVDVTLNGETVTANTDGSYTVNLQNRSNIIGVTATTAAGTKSLYRVVDARLIQVNMVNATTSSTTEFNNGDTANISFTGITMPVYKLAGIYNPTWYSASWGSNGTYVYYTGTSAVGRCGQWDLATNNTMSVPIESTSNVNLTAGRISSMWWGENLGEDKKYDNAHFSANTNAQTKEDQFSTMPNITIPVSGGAASGGNVTGITITTSINSLKVGKTKLLQANVLPETATNKNVTWTGYFYDTVKGSWELDSGYYFTVNSNGKITAKHAPVSGGTVTKFKARATSVSNPEIFGESMEFTIGN